MTNKIYLLRSELPYASSKPKIALKKMKKFSLEIELTDGRRFYFDIYSISYRGGKQRAMNILKKRENEFTNWYHWEFRSI